MSDDARSFISIAEEKIFRRLLATGHGCPIMALYGDDGELSCSSCGIDFKRMSARDIESQLIAFARVKMENPTARPGDFWLGRVRPKHGIRNPEQFPVTEPTGV